MLERKDVLTDDLMMAPKTLTKDFQGLYDMLVNISKVSRDIRLPGSGGGTSPATGASGSGTSSSGGGDNGASSTKKLKDETAALTAQQKELAKVQQQIAILTAKDTEEYRKQAKELAALKQQLKEKTALGDKDAKTLTKQNASLLELRAALQANRVSYAQLVTEEQRASKEGQHLLKVIQDQDVAVKELSGSTGDHTGHVGDYKGQMKALKDELKLAKDEMVAIANTLGEDSEEFAAAAEKAGGLADKIEDIGDAAKVAKADTGFEKLGNQFGMLTSKLKNLDFKGASLQLKGISETAKGMTFKETVSGLGGLTKGFASLGKALLTHPLFLIAAIVIGIVVAVVALKDKILPLKIAFEAVGKAIDFVTQAAKDFADWMGISSFAAEEAAHKQAEAAEKLRDKLVQRYDDEIKLAQAAGKETIAMEKAKAKAIQDTAEKQIDALKKVLAIKNLDKDEQEDDEDYKRLQELIKLEHDASIEIQAIKLREGVAIKEIQAGVMKEIEKQREDRAKLEQFRLSESIRVQNEILNNEAKVNEQRIAAAVKAEKIKNQLIKAESKEQLQKIEGKGDVFAEALIREKANAAIVENQKATQKIITGIMLTELLDQAKILEEEASNVKHSWEERIQLTTQGSEKQIEILDFQLKKQLISQEDYQKEYLKIEQDTTDKVVALMLERQAALAAAAQDRQDIGSNELLTDLEKAFGAGEVSLKDYLARRAEIIEQAKRNELQMALDTAKEELAILQKNGEDSVGIRKLISGLELTVEQEKNAKILEGEQKLAEALHELMTTGVDNALQIIDNLNEHEDIKREERLAKIQENLEYDLQLAGDNEEKKLELKRKAEVEEAKIRKEQAAADRKRAIFEKAVAATSIGVNTAKGVVMALGNYIPPVSFVLAAVTAALGAIQLAAVLSKPIPSYAKGTKNHPGGLALVAEAGSEIIKEPGSAPYLQKDPHILDLPPHTQVIPHAETMQALALSGANRYDSRQVRAEEPSYDMTRLETRLDALKNKKEVHINLTKAGVETIFVKAASREKFLNDFYH